MAPIPSEPASKVTLCGAPLATATALPGAFAPFKLGHELMTARELDWVCQVNYRTVGSKLDELDEFYGALGVATLKIAVVGRAMRDPSLGKDFFHIDKIGVYIRDTYDFNDTGLEMVVPPGIWNRDRCLSKTEMVEYAGILPAQIYHRYQGFVPAFNRDFRRWQNAQNTGSDFVNYSDVLWFPSNQAPIPIPL